MHHLAWTILSPLTLTSPNSVILQEDKSQHSSSQRPREAKAVVDETKSGDCDEAEKEKARMKVRPITPWLRCTSELQCGLTRGETDLGACALSGHCERSCL